MKASSSVLTSVQKPFTLAGLPSQVFILLAGGWAVLFVTPAAFGFLGLSIPLSFGFAASFWVVCYRKNQRDWHFANYWTISNRFWSGKSVRTLVCGKPLPKKGGK